MNPKTIFNKLFSNNKNESLIFKENRFEKTLMPMYLYHLPLDNDKLTLPPNFDPPIFVKSEALPLPPISERHGSVTSDEEYLDWWKFDKEIIFKFIKETFPNPENLHIMDFGCSSGRILRHFYSDIKNNNFKMYGCDISARRVQWIREFFPEDFEVYTGSIMPSLPFEDNSLDVIYGMSVFTHIKFLWDAWLLEMRRVLRPGGLLIQSVHTEYAYEHFWRNRDNKEYIEALDSDFINYLNNNPKMPVNFIYFGNIDSNNVFLKEKIVLKYWGRYFKEIRIQPPPEKYSYQNWVIAKK